MPRQLRARSLLLPSSHSTSWRAHGAGDWHDAGARLVAARATYHLVSRWDGTLAYRWLDVEASTRHGAAASVHRHLGDHVKLGVGYDFTSFSDDLARMDDYELSGWFVSVVGSY